jgi:hypothetical protein
MGRSPEKSKRHHLSGWGAIVPHMIRFTRLLALSVPLLLAGVGAADAGNVSGTPRIVDGDTLTISEAKVRLESI